MGDYVIDDTSPLSVVDEGTWPIEPWGSDGCSCHGNTEPEDNMLCMPPHVFVFCVLLSAIVSGIVVSSQRIWEKLNQLVRRSAYVHNPHYRHSHVAGTLGTESEETLVEAAKAMDRAAATPVENSEVVPPRYVRAFCGNEKHALGRWKATLQWRKDNDIDSILNEPQPFFHDIRRYFPSNMSGRSRGGHIVVYEKLADVDMRALNKELGITVPMLLRHWIFVSEYMYRVLQPTDSAQQVTVVDMAGTRIQSVAGKIQEYIKGAAQLARLYYVERCHKTFVVNAPAWFGLSFRVVSPFLSARTRQKIRIMGSDLSALQDEIDPQNLPVEYGGKNSTPVCDSPEERRLRRLVDAINANANRANTHGNSNGDVSMMPGKLNRTPPRVRRGKTSPSRNGKSSTVQEVKRSRSGKGVVDIAPVTPKTGRKGRQTPTSNRSRASTDEGTPVEALFLDQKRSGKRSAGDGAAAGGAPSLEPRRASWAEGGRGGRELVQARAEAEVEAAFESWRASSAVETSLVDRGEGEGVARGGDRTWRKGGDVGADGDKGVGPVRVYGQRRVAVSPGCDGRNDGNVERGAYDEPRGVVEDSLPIEDRLQAVMKDLGVPLEACVMSDDRELSRGRRELQITAVGGIAVGNRSTSATEPTVGASRMGEGVVSTAETSRDGVSSRVDGDSDLSREGPPKPSPGVSWSESDSSLQQHSATPGDNHSGEASTTNDTPERWLAYSATADVRSVTLVAIEDGNNVK